MRSNWRVPVLALAAATLSVGACYAPPANVGSRFVKSVRVDSAQGAVITVSSEESPELAGTRLTIEPGALAADTTITLELGFDPIVSEAAAAAGPVAIFGPAGTVFAKPARMTLPVEVPAGYTEADLFVQVVEETGESTRIPRELLDVSSGSVSFVVTGFTSFQPGTANQQPHDAGHIDAGHADAGQDAGTSCNSNAHCSALQLCINGHCVTCTGGACSGMCTTNAHCSTGRVCVGGQCVLPSDAGTDAGVPQSCDPIFQNCNTAGEYCYLDTTRLVPVSYCSVPGTRDRGQSCTSPTDCFTTNPTKKGLHCAGLAPNGGSGFCRDYCDPTVPSSGSCAQVPVPQICVPIVGGAVGPGYCDPV